MGPTNSTAPPPISVFSLSDFAAKVAPIIVSVLGVGITIIGIANQVYIRLAPGILEVRRQWLYDLAKHRTPSLRSRLQKIQVGEGPQVAQGAGRGVHGAGRGVQGAAQVPAQVPAQGVGPGGAQPLAPGQGPVQGLVQPVGTADMNKVDASTDR